MMYAVGSAHPSCILRVSKPGPPSVLDTVL
jgi:hypothetical protein